MDRLSAQVRVEAPKRPAVLAPHSAAGPALGARLGPRPKIGTIKRWLIGAIALLLLCGEIEGYFVLKSIREYYFQDYSHRAPGLADAAVALLTVYLASVAAIGRWSLCRRPAKVGEDGDRR